MLKLTESAAHKLRQMSDTGTNTCFRIVFKGFG